MGGLRRGHGTHAGFWTSHLSVRSVAHAGELCVPGLYWVLTVLATYSDALLCSCDSDRSVGCMGKGKNQKQADGGSRNVYPTTICTYPFAGF